MRHPRVHQGSTQDPRTRFHLSQASVSGRRYNDGADTGGNNKENLPPCAPVSYIPNIPNSLLFYPIYVKNPAYRGPCNNNNFTPGCEQRVILTPFIKYSTDYTHMFGTLGEGQEIWSLTVTSQ